MTPSLVTILGFFVAAPALMFGLFVVDDAIVRHVCQRERRRYSLLWMFDSYWLGRVFALSWYKDAKDAGRFSARFCIFILWVLLIVFLGLIGMKVIEI
jgi:hypothetical protein